MKILATNYIHRSLGRSALLLVPLVLICFALSPQTRAVCQEGCDTVNANTFLGDNALLNNTGGSNTAVGAGALESNTTGPANTANGANALSSNTIGCCNTADGVNALSSNTSGGGNTASGLGSLVSNTTGDSNTANGANALSSNTTGFNNTASGGNALFENTIGNNNTATGVDALRNNTTGNDNTADGPGSLYNNTTGNGNTASGQNALRHNTTGKGNIALGSHAGINLTTGSNNIDIFDRGVADESNTIRIGDPAVHTATYIAGIYGQVVAPATATPVLIDGSGRLGTMLGPISSARRFKHDIKAMDKASESILALEPVTFRYKHELDPSGTPQFGLVAEDVEKVNPDLVARDEQGKPYTVRYEAVNAMLLNEFLKAHRKMEEQEANIARQQKQIEALTAGLQKVSAQLELSRPAPQVTATNQ